MQEDYQLLVVTTDRDLGSSVPYDNVQTDTWVTYGTGVKIMYCSPGKLQKATIKGIIKTVNPSCIYLNGMFSRYFTIYPLLISRQLGWPYKIVLQPHGMLKESALQFKAAKKKLFLGLFKLFGFQKHITFQATDETEFKDVIHKLGKEATAVLVPNFPGYIPPYESKIAKISGELKIIFIGRIHPIKNLDFLLNCMSILKGDVSLTVIGNEEDKDFARQCREIVQSLPANITVDFIGERSHHQLPAFMAMHHVFALPTKGENFGYAIFEALAAGLPALISDQTPWVNLSTKKAGWDLPLDKPEQFATALQQAIDFDQEAYQQWSTGAWTYINEKVKETDLKTIYQKLFN